MSGGFFNHAEWQNSEIAEAIDQLIVTNNTLDEYGYARNFSAKTIERFKEAAQTLRQAQAMARRVDYLVSDDDGENAFHERWAKEVPPYYKSTLDNS